MDVLPATDTIIAMKCFSHLNSRLGTRALASVMLVLLMSGCQPPEIGPTPTLSLKTDITEDLYHRLKAGLFTAGTDPMIIRIEKDPIFFHELEIPFYIDEAPYKMMRVSWERGSFWVKPDNHALVVIYLDPEATYSHVEIATLRGYTNAREFRVGYEHPIR